MQDAPRFDGGVAYLSTSQLPKGCCLARSVLGVGFDPADFLDAAGMAPPFELRPQPELDHSIHEPVPEQVGGEAEHIRIVVTTAHLCGEIVMAAAGPHTGELVCRDAHSHPRAADQDPPLDVSARDRLSDFRGEVGVIHTVWRVGSHIARLMTEFGNHGDDFSLDGEPSVIAGNRNFHS